MNALGLRPAHSPSPWRYQGRILESNGGTGNAEVYDAGARAYVPDLGTFTSLDSVSGSAQNPLSLNRYLYANANPETLTDPDGHATCDPSHWCGSAALNPAVSGWSVTGLSTPTVTEASGTGCRATGDCARKTATVSRRYGRQDSDAGQSRGSWSPADEQRFVAANTPKTCDNIVCGATNAVGGAVQFGVAHPGDVLAWGGAIAVTGAVCLGLGAGTACAAAAISYFGAAAIKNTLENKGNVLDGDNPLDMMLSVGSAGLLDKVGAGKDIATRFIQGAYAGLMADGTSQIGRNPGKLPNACELGASTIGGGISNMLPSGVPTKDLFFGGFVSSGIGGLFSRACDFVP